MKLYELTYLISPNTNEEELVKTIQEIKTYISDNQGEVKTEVGAMPIKLDYPVSGFTTAYMGSFDINLEQDKVLGLVKFIENQSIIINHIICAKKISAPRPEREHRAPVIEKAEEAIAQVEEEAKEEPIKEKKVELENLDQKLDEILGEE